MQCITDVELTCRSITYTELLFLISLRSGGGGDSLLVDMSTFMGQKTFGEATVSSAASRCGNFTLTTAPLGSK